jgi:hypothetical protein
MPDLTSSPTVDEVVDALRRSTPATSITVRLPGLHPMARMLGLLVLVLLAVLMTMSWHLVRQVEGLMSGIRHHRSEAAKPVAPTLPATEKLLDAGSFRRELEASPNLSGHLHLARARALMAQRHSIEAALDFALAERINPRLLNAGDRIAWAGAMLEAGCRERSLALIRSVDIATLDETLRRRVSALMVELLLSDRKG